MPRQDLLESLRQLLRSYLTDAGRAAGANLARLIFFTALGQICALASVYVLTEGLGRERFGILASALALQGYLLTIGSAGVKSVVVREGARRPHELPLLMSCHLLITAASATAVALLITIGILLSSSAGTEKQLLVLVAFGNVAACVDNRPFFDIHHRQSASAAIGLGSELLALAVLVALQHTGAISLPLVGALFVAKWVLASAWHYLLYHRWIAPLRWRCTALETRVLWRSSWPLLLSGLVVNVPLTAGVIFVRAFQGGGEAAILGLAQQAGQAFLLFAALSHRILQPHISSPHGTSPSFLKRLSIFTAGFLGLLWAGGFAASAGLILGVLDPDYHAAVLPTGAVLLAMLIASAASLGTLYLITFKQETAIFRLNLGVSAAYVVAVWLLVPHYSYMAAIAAMLAACVVRAGLVLLLVSRQLGRNRETGGGGVPA